MLPQEQHMVAMERCNIEADNRIHGGETVQMAWKHVQWLAIAVKADKKQLTDDEAMAAMAKVWAETRRMTAEAAARERERRARIEASRPHYEPTPSTGFFCQQLGGVTYCNPN